MTRSELGRILARPINHLALAFVVTLLVLIAVNALFSSRYPWWLWVLMAWMPLVALHTAWSIGLFDKLLGKDKEGS